MKSWLRFFLAFNLAFAVWTQQATAESRAVLELFVVGKVSGDNVGESLKSVPIFGKLLGETETGRILAVVSHEGSNILYFKAKKLELSQKVATFTIDATEYFFDLNSGSLKARGVNSANASKRSLTLTRIYKTSLDPEQLSRLASANASLEEANAANQKRLASSEQEIRDLLVKLEAAKQLNETLIKTDRENLAQNREEIARLKLLKRNLASDKAESEKNTAPLYRIFKT